MVTSGDHVPIKGHGEPVGRRQPGSVAAPPRRGSLGHAQSLRARPAQARGAALKPTARPRHVTAGGPVVGRAGAWNRARLWGAPCSGASAASSPGVPRTADTALGSRMRW